MIIRTYAAEKGKVALNMDDFSYGNTIITKRDDLGIVSTTKEIAEEFHKKFEDFKVVPVYDGETGEPIEQVEKTEEEITAFKKQLLAELLNIVSFADMIQPTLKLIG